MASCLGIYHTGGGGKRDHREKGEGYVLIPLSGPRSQVVSLLLRHLYTFTYRRLTPPHASVQLLNVILSLEFLRGTMKKCFFVCPSTIGTFSVAAASPDSAAAKDEDVVKLIGGWRERGKVRGKMTSGLAGCQAVP